MLISQTIPFMFITTKYKSEKLGLKSQHVLLPADLKKVQALFPGTCNDNDLITLALK